MHIALVSPFWPMHLHPNGIVTYLTPTVTMGDTVYLPDGQPANVVEVYDDEEHGQQGGVQATLVVDG